MLRNGLNKTYYQTGELYEEQFWKDGVLNGTYKIFYPNGALRSLNIYCEGRLIRNITYDENNNILNERYVEIANIISGDITIDLDAMQVFCKNKKVYLRPKEYDMLVYFIRHPNSLVTRNELAAVMESNIVENSNSRTIDTHIKNIRSALGKSARRLQTVFGRGFRWTEEK